MCSGYVSARAGDPIVFVILRDGKEVSLTATPRSRRTEGCAGQYVVKLGLIGVVNDEEVGQPRVDRIQSGRRLSSKASAKPAISSSGPAIFLKRFVVGREDKCQLGGPVKIADMAGKAAKQGFDWLVQLVALLSVGIGILEPVADSAARWRAPAVLRH